MPSAHRKPHTKQKAATAESPFQHLLAVEAALARILPMTQPADAELNRFFRAHPDLGKHDRQFIAETVFGLLRRRISLEYHTRADTTRRLLIAYLNRVQGMSLRQLEPLIGKGDVEWASHVKSRADEEVPLYVQAELPEWLTAMLAPDMAAEEILALGRALQQPAPLDLRVNALTADRHKVMQQLAVEGFKVAATPYSPLGIRIDGNPALGRNALFTSGRVEIQDEGSQILSYLVAPKRREMIVDFCAGAGGKTLALGALMHSQGRLYAFDVSDTRLSKMKPRLKRSGLSNVHPQLIASENDIKVKRLAGKIDRVLVDAPCSGLGTLRRNPDLKWRQSPESVAEMRVKQAAILRSAATLVKPGGRLVYATCSLLKEENEEIVESFVSAHPNFSVKSPAEILSHHGIKLDAERYLRLWPHLHRTDGFFAAVFERNMPIASKS